MKLRAPAAMVTCCGLWLACGAAAAAQAGDADGEAAGHDALALKWSYRLSGWAPESALPRVTAKDRMAIPMERLSVDVSLDSTAKYGASQDASLTWAPLAGIHESGWRVRLSFNRSVYSYPIDGPVPQRVHGRSTQWDTLLGYGLHRPSWAATFLLGQAHAQADEGGQTTVSGRSMKATASVFAAPTEKTRTFASLAYTEVSDYTQAVWKWGWLAGPSGAFAGPEWKADWRRKAVWKNAPQVSRWGLHLSGLGWGGLSLSASAGRMWGEAYGVGGYLALGLYSAL